MREKRSQQNDRLRRYIGRVLGAHDRLSKPIEALQKERAYRSATSPTLAHLTENGDAFEACFDRALKRLKAGKSR